MLVVVERVKLRGIQDATCTDASGATKGAVPRSWRPRLQEQELWSARGEAGRERVRVFRGRARSDDAHRGLAPRDARGGEALGGDGAQRRHGLRCLRVHGAQGTVHRGLGPRDGAQGRRLRVGTAQGRLKRHFCSDFSPFFALRRGWL